MRVLVYSDAQATDGHERCIHDPSKPLQLWRIERLFDQLRRIYDEYSCQALWDLGDTTDDRTAIPVSVIDLLCDRMESFDGEWNVKLVGNHEQLLRDTRVHAGKMFRRFFHVVEGCESIKVGKVNILCVSYHDDIEPVLKFVRQQPKNNTGPILLVGHFQLAGCQMPSGTAASGFDKEFFRFVNLGLLGHVHRPQQLGNLHYVGSPFQQNWGESGEDKRVAVLDITDDSIDVTWVPLGGFPSYRQVGLDEFIERVKTPSEDRYKVVLRTLEETERFYSHLQCGRADEAIFAYEQEAVTAGDNYQIPRTKKDIMAMYVKKNPPVDSSVPLDDEGMIEFGESLTDQKI
jgi:DNA repair exonuclease SbcCD nuclease subunit